MNAPLSLLDQPAKAEPDILAWLKTRTRDAHAATEASLTAFRPPFQRDAFATTIARLLTFQRLWEDALATHRLFDDYRRERGRIETLQSDLLALEAGAPPPAPAWLVGRVREIAGAPARALGSAYVMEGSKLGGHVIARWLARETWTPPAGFATFERDGARVAEDWRRFRGWFLSVAAGRDRDQIGDGADQTFAVLREWLAA